MAERGARKHAEHANDVDFDGKTEPGQREQRHAAIDAQAARAAEIRAEEMGKKNDSVLEQIMRQQQASGEVYLLNENGKPEKWRIFEVYDDCYLLNKGSRQREVGHMEAAYGEYRIVSPEEAITDQRAAEYVPSLEQSWDTVANAMSTITSDSTRKKASAFLSANKEAIIRTAAHRAAGEHGADLDQVLLDAVRDTLEDEGFGDTLIGLERAVDANDAMMAIRFPTGESSDLDATDPRAIARVARERATDSDEVLRLIADVKADAAALETTVPKIALEPTQGDIRPIDALRAFLAFDAPLISIEGVDNELARLERFRTEIASEPNPILRAAALVDIQHRQLALQAQRKTMVDGEMGIAEKIARQMEVSQQLAETHRGREQAQDLATWRKYDDENWQLFKEACIADGHAEQVSPKNHSVVYGTYKAMLDRGEISREDAIADLLDHQSNSERLNAWEREGIQALYDELTATAASEEVTAPLPPSSTRSRPIPFNTLRKNNEEYGKAVNPQPNAAEEAVRNRKRNGGEPRVTADKTELKPEPAVTTGLAEPKPEPKVTTGKAKLRSEPGFGKQEDAPTPVSVEIDEEPASDNEPSAPRAEFLPDKSVLERDNNRFLRPELTPASQRRRDILEDEWFDTRPSNQKEQRRDGDELYAKKEEEPITTYHEPLRKVAQAFGGVDEFHDLMLQLEAAGVAPFEKEKLYNLEKLSKAKIAKAIEEVRDAVNKLPEKPDGGWMEKKEVAKTSYDAIAERFGGHDMFDAIYKKVYAFNERHPEYQLPTLEKLKTMNLDEEKWGDLILNYSREIGIYQGFDSYRRNLTPYEQLVDAYGGEEALQYAYDELVAKGQEPFDLEKLKNKKSLSPKKMQAVIDAMREAAASTVEKKEFGQTPFEQVVDALGGGRIFEAEYERLDKNGTLPYTKEQIRNMQTPKWYQRLWPGTLTPEKVIDAFNRAIAKKDAKSTFSGRKGGRGKL